MVGFGGGDGRGETGEPGADDEDVEGGHFVATERGVGRS